MKKIKAALLIAVGIINFLPLVGVLSSDVLSRLYGIPTLQGDLLLLMQHRAILFGVIGGLILTAVVRVNLQPAAIVCGFISMIGFILLVLLSGTATELGDRIHRVAWIDAVALVFLAVFALLRWRFPER